MELSALSAVEVAGVLCDMPQLHHLSMTSPYLGLQPAARGFRVDTTAYTLSAGFDVNMCAWSAPHSGVGKPESTRSRVAEVLQDGLSYCSDADTLRAHMELGVSTLTPDTLAEGGFSRACTDWAQVRKFASLVSHVTSYSVPGFHTTLAHTWSWSSGRRSLAHAKC